MVILGSTYEELQKVQNEVIAKLRRNKNLSRIELIIQKINLKLN